MTSREVDRIHDVEHRSGSRAAVERGHWRPWLDSHLNRELGVGALPRGWRDPPSRVAIDILLEELGQPQRRYDRIGIDGAPITDQALARLFARIASAETKMSLALSWFEVVTAAAMMWFAWQKVDLAVVEVGLGGEHDATAVAMPALVALTNIDLDHTELFGTTRPDVASAESTIVTAGHGLVLGESDPSLRGCFTRRRPRPLWVRGVDFGVSERASTSKGQVITLETPAASYRAV